MLIPVELANGIQRIETEVEQLTFTELGIREINIEEFIRNNIDSLFGDDESLLIVGQQVKNRENGRCDLVALDGQGNLVLIEIKRDAEDMRKRKEPFEFQAIRYAANFARIKNPADLVDKLFAPYIDKHKDEFGVGELTSREMGSRIVDQFLSSSNAERTFNLKQRIVLISSDFDRQTESACAWLIENGVDISCIKITPIRYNESVFLEIIKILPPQSIENYYVDVVDQNVKPMESGIESKVNRSYLPRMPQLFEWGLIKKGDKLKIKNYEDSEAEVIDAYYVKYRDRKMKYNKWGQKVTGWSSIGIYEWAVHIEQGATLDELRRQKNAESQETSVDN